MTDGTLGEATGDRTTPAVRLRPMSVGEFEAWVPAAIEEYAEDHIRMGSMPADKAHDMAKKQFGGAAAGWRCDGRALSAHRRGGRPRRPACRHPLAVHPAGGQRPRVRLRRRRRPVGARQGLRPRPHAGRRGLLPRARCHRDPAARVRRQHGRPPTLREPRLRGHQHQHVQAAVAAGVELAACGVRVGARSCAGSKAQRRGMSLGLARSAAILRSFVRPRGGASSAGERAQILRKPPFLSRPVATDGRLTWTDSREPAPSLMSLGVPDSR